ncbi:MAG: zinc ribbon domain-containing protein [Planctomycetota bacterium]|nr:zinc ribbon domain-containing protein [Planctomycetota bacterium]
MPIAIRCKCGKDLKVKDELAGKAVKCPGCGTVLKVVAPQARPAVPVAAAGKPGTKVVPGKAGPQKPGTKVGARPGGLPAKGAKPADDLGLIGLPEDMMPKSETAKSQTCKKCGAPYYSGDLFCMKCGLDFKTGKPVEQRKEKRSYWWVKPMVILLILGGIGAGVYFKFFAIKEEEKKDDGTKEEVVVDPFEGLRKAVTAENPENGPIGEALAKHGLDALPILQEIMKEAQNEKLYLQKGLVRAMAILTGVSLYNNDVCDLTVKLLEKKDFPQDVFALAVDALLSMGTGKRADSINAILAQPVGPTSLENVFSEHDAKKATEPLRRGIEALLNNRNFLDVPLIVRVSQTLFDAGESDAVPLVLDMALSPEKELQDAGIEALFQMLGLRKGPEDWRHWWNYNKGKPRYAWWIEALQEPSDEVRTACIERLKKYLGEKAPAEIEYIFDSTASQEQKDAVAKKWAQWWEENKSNPKLK